jgi:superfamily I DNA/RNA helicase
MDKIVNGPLGKTRVRVIEEKFSNAGIYVWQLPSGKYFTDGEGNALSIESMINDVAKIKELTDAAAHYGQPEGKPVFFSNVKKISDEEYSEQQDRMAQGFIPSSNDLGALIAAKNTQLLYGSED